MACSVFFSPALFHSVIFDTVFNSLLLRLSSSLFFIYPFSAHLYFPGLIVLSLHSWSFLLTFHLLWRKIYCVVLEAYSFYFVYIFSYPNRTIKFKTCVTSWFYQARSIQEVYKNCVQTCSKILYTKQIISEKDTRSLFLTIYSLFQFYWYLQWVRGKDGCLITKGSRVRPPMRTPVVQKSTLNCRFNPWDYITIMR